jgi:DNA-3-methyladenine glycosylase
VANGFPREALGTDTLHAARALIGVRIVRGSGPNARVARIVEVEAYIGSDDLASHARFGRTRRNGTMFGPPGHAYVYFVYGMYHCLNVVTEPEGTPAAVLIRAVQPIAGLEAMRLARSEHRRGAGRARPGGFPEDARLAAGPGLVCAALSITRTDDGVDLCDPASDLRLEPAPASEPAPALAAGPRVGIGYAPEPWLGKPWRFFEPGNPSVSRPAKTRGPER